MSAKNSSVRRAESIAKATAQTRSAIEDLKGRLSGEAHDVAGRYVTSAFTINREDSEPQESEEELERQLQAYFERAGAASRRGPNVVPSACPQLLDELRSRVVDVTAERILAIWSCPKPGMSLTVGLGTELTERLVQRILEQLRKPAEVSKSRADQVKSGAMAVPARADGWQFAPQPAT